MNELQLVKSKPFGAVECDFYENSSKDVLMTRKQIGEALEYKNPQWAIDKIHAKNKDRLDKFSVTTGLVATDGRTYPTTLYTAKGVYEICRFSRQPKADKFVDFVWDTIEAIRKGAAYVPPTAPLTPSPSGVATLINTLRRIVYDQGGTANDVALLAQGICGQYGIVLPVQFVKELPGQFSFLAGGGIHV